MTSSKRVKSLRLSNSLDSQHTNRVLLYTVAIFLIMIATFGAGYFLGFENGKMEPTKSTYMTEKTNLPTNQPAY